MDKRNFNGFPRDFLMLLAENAFNDSKSYYESVKQQIKDSSTVPMRMLCSDLSEKLYELDDRMVLIPSKMVSRVRRDTRFSKNKDMYRSNMWAMFMRDKNQRKPSPCMWFEVAPGGWSCGVGIFRSEPYFMDMYRKMILENPEEFRKAIKLCEDSGAVCDIEQYKKLKPGSENLDKDLIPYYNAKYIYFIDYSSELEPLFDGSIEDIMLNKIETYSGLYRFIMKICERLTAEGEAYE